MNVSKPSHPVSVRRTSLGRHILLLAVVSRFFRWQSSPTWSPADGTGHCGMHGFRTLSRIGMSPIQTSATAPALKASRPCSTASAARWRALRALPSDALVYAFSHGQFMQAVRQSLLHPNWTAQQKMAHFWAFNAQHPILNADQVEAGFEAGCWTTSLSVERPLCDGYTAAARQRRPPLAAPCPRPTGMAFTRVQKQLSKKFCKSWLFLLTFEPIT